MDSNKSRVARQKKRRLKTRYKIIIPLLLVILAAGVYVWHLDSKAGGVAKEIHEDLHHQSDYRDPDKVINPKYDNVSVLIMGIDSSDTRGNDEIARTDALLVATFNVEEKSVKLLSIPRDSLVYIPFLNKYDKINHAHAFAHRGGKGPTETVRTVENLLEMPIDYYVRVNFEAFMEIVDALNGIDIDVPYEFKEQDSQDRANAIHLLPGMQRLNGEEALALARTRKKDSDYMRGQRQQEIIKAIAKRAISFKTLFDNDDLFDAIENNMKTNMTYSEMKSFFSYIMQGKNLQIDNLNIEGTDYRPGRIYYWKLDEDSLNEVADEMRDHLDITKKDYSYEDDIEQNKRGYSENDIIEQVGPRIAQSNPRAEERKEPVPENNPPKQEPVAQKDEPKKTAEPPKKSESENPDDNKSSEKTDGDDNKDDGKKDDEDDKDTEKNPDKEDEGQNENDEDNKSDKDKSDDKKENEKA